MASDRRTGGRLEDHPVRAAFGRARRMDACCRTCLCSCALDPTRVAKSSPVRHQRHRAQRAIRRSPNAHRELARAGVVPVHPYGSELEHRRCRNAARAARSLTAAGARRAAAGHHGQARQRPRAQLLDDGDPGLVEEVGRRRRPAARHPVGLLDEHHDDSEPVRHFRRQHEVGRADAAARAVAEDERAAGVAGRMQVRPRGAVRECRARACARR